MRRFTAYLLGWTGAVLALVGRPAHVGAQAPGPTWDLVQQANASRFVETLDMAVDAAGNTYVVGDFDGTLTFHDGQQLTTPTYLDGNGFVVKYTSTGTVAWVRHLGGSTSAAVFGVAVDAAGNVYVAGQFSGQFAGRLELGNGVALATLGSTTTAFVAKYDAQGVAQWARQGQPQHMGNISVAHDVAVDAAGNVYLAGWLSPNITSSVSFGGVALAPAPGTAFTYFVAKYDTGGTAQWALADGSGTGIGMAYLAVAPGGEAYLSCSMRQNAVFAGHAYASRGGGADAFVVKYDAGGTRQWIQQFGGPGADEAGRGAVDASGNLYLPLSFSDQADVGGTILHSAGDQDLALLKLSDLGVLAWARTAGGPGPDVALNAAFDPQGNAYLVGQFSGTATAGAGTSFTSAGHLDALFLSYTAQGTLRWGTATGGTNPDAFHNIGFDGAGRGWAVGPYGYTLALGAVTLTPPSGGRSNFFMARFTDPAGGAGPPETRLSFSPNPTSGEVRVPGVPVGNRVLVLDAMGRVARETTVSAASEVSVRGLKPGLYVLRTPDAAGHWVAGRVAVE